MRRWEQRSVGSKLRSGILRICTVQFGEIGIPSSPGEYAVRLIAAGWETSYVILSCASSSNILLSFGADDFDNPDVGPSTVKANSTRYCNREAASCRPPPHVGYRSTGIITVLSLSTDMYYVLTQIRVCESRGFSDTHLTGWGASGHGQHGPILDPSSGRPLPTRSSPVLLPCAAPPRVQRCAQNTAHRIPSPVKGARRARLEPPAAGGGACGAHGRGSATIAEGRVLESKRLKHSPNRRST